jgi:hypothetical protein
MPCIACWWDLLNRHCILSLVKWGMSDMSSQIERFYLTECDSGFHAAADPVLYFGEKFYFLRLAARNKTKSHIRCD